MLERWIQLHQTVKIHYVVDGYIASYMVNDGMVGERSVKAATVEEALKGLEESLNSNPPTFGGPFRCANCRDKKQWYSEDNGQVVTCAVCVK